MPPYHRYHNHRKPEKIREKKKPATSPSLAKIIKILIEQRSLIEFKKPKSKKTKILEETISGVEVSEEEVEVIYNRKIEIKKTYKISPKPDHYGFIPKGWIPINQETLYELTEQLGHFDQGGYIRGNRQSFPLINLKTKKIRGRCALTNKICNSDIPIVCYECNSYKEYISSEKENK